MNSNMRPIRDRLATAAILVAVLATTAVADPCGMVPPIYINDSTPIARVGDQMTYVFFKDGVETFVIRPGFTGKVEEFGMLIPFPTPPAIRKVSENIFAHVAAAIDPPEVVVYAAMHYGGRYDLGGFGNLAKKPTGGPSLEVLERQEVRVLREEAVGMYEVAVLEAGSAAALKKWMEEHKYKYPDGMDKVADDYVDLGWCFVAVKTKVGGKAGVDPQPGQRTVKTGLPAGSSFDGHIQAMGFRFKTKNLVVPMRLSAFNEGELHNIVYLLTDGPKKIRSIPEEYVVRQVSGEELYDHVTKPLPLRIIGGTEADIPAWRRKNLPSERNPVPHNGNARDLFAGDMLALAKDRLSHPHEEAEKILLRIGERLGLRGTDIDKHNLAALAKDRLQAVKDALADVKKMTLTVIDGDFPREVLAGQNLSFAEYRMPASRNKAEHYDAKSKKPAGKQQGVLRLGRPDIPSLQQKRSRAGPVFLGAALAVALGLAVLGLTLMRRPAG